MSGLVVLALGLFAYFTRRSQLLLTVIIGSAFTDAFNLFVGLSQFDTSAMIGVVMLLHRRAVSSTFFRRLGPVFLVLVLPIVVGFYFVTVAPFDDSYETYRAATQQLTYKYVIQVLRSPEILFATYAAYVALAAFRDPRAALLKSFGYLVALLVVATAVDFGTDNALKQLLFERTTDDRVTGLSLEPRELAREMGLLLITLVTVYRGRRPTTRLVVVGAVAAVLMLGTYSVSGLGTTFLVLLGYLIYRYPLDYRTYLVPVAVLAVGATAITGSEAVRTHIKIRTLDKLETSLLNYVPEAPVWVSGLEVFDGAAVAFFYNHPEYLALGTGPNLVNIPASVYVSQYQRLIFPYGLVSTPHMGLIKMVSNGGIVYVLLQFGVWFGFTRGMRSRRPELADWVALVFCFDLIVTVSYLYIAAGLAVAIDLVEGDRGPVAAA